MASVQGADRQQSGFRQMGFKLTSFKHGTVVTLVLATCLSSAALAETIKEFRYTVGPNANISVDTQYGSISVKPGSGNAVVVTATLKSDNVEVDQQQNGNRIEIASHLLRSTDEQSGRVDYELLVPPDATVNLRSSTGPLSAERLQGDLTLEGADAAVKVRNVENCHVHVSTMRGPITLTDVRNGHVELNSIGGDIYLKSVTGPLVQATTSRGKIVYDGDFGSSGDYKFTTHTGDIEALVPADVSADFRAHSVLGRVQHDFPLQPKHSRFREEVGRSFLGTTGKAGSEVVLRSFSGKIRLKQR
ncbi:MAG: DUF4097 family beta strand repeat-containing protein [Terriglobales bacterium]